MEKYDKNGNLKKNGEIFDTISYKTKLGDEFLFTLPDPEETEIKEKECDYNRSNHADADNQRWTDIPQKQHGYNKDKQETQR